MVARVYDLRQKVYRKYEANLICLHFTQPGSQRRKLPPEISKYHPLRFQFCLLYFLMLSRYDDSHMFNAAACLPPHSPSTRGWHWLVLRFAVRRRRGSFLIFSRSLRGGFLLFRPVAGSDGVLGKEGLRIWLPDLVVDRLPFIYGLWVVS